MWPKCLRFNSIDSNELYRIRLHNVNQRNDTGRANTKCHLIWFAWEILFSFFVYHDRDIRKSINGVEHSIDQMFEEISMRQSIKGRRKNRSKQNEINEKNEHFSVESIYFVNLISISMSEFDQIYHPPYTSSLRSLTLFSHLFCSVCTNE